MRRDGSRIALAHGAAVELGADGRLVLLGAGKAAAPMAAAVIDVLAREPDRGLVVTKDGHAEPVPGCQVLESAHPVPDERCVAAADSLLACCEGLTAADLLVCCLTGGASALIGAPAEGIPLSDQARTVDLLLGCGADIAAVNCVRRHVTRLGGGGLLAAASPAQVLTLAVSDVLGDDPATIGSGPTWSDPSTFGQAVEVCREHGIWQRLPIAVRTHLEAGIAGRVAETLKPGDPRAARARYLVVAGNDDAQAAAAAELTAAGRGVTRAGAALEGDAAAAGRAFGRRLAAMAEPSGALIAGGETTVVLPGDHGLGGRNQHFALAAAEAIRGLPLAILAAGTDGTDGPTDAAGAIVDGATWDRIPDAAGHLARCDAYPALERAGCLLRTGPTGTNVMDIAIGIASPPRA